MMLLEGTGTFLARAHHRVADEGTARNDGAGQTMTQTRVFESLWSPL